MHSSTGNKAETNASFDYPPIREKKVIIFLGAYGSGKSEVAVNTALQMAQQNADPAMEIVLADLDIINPFYRSFDAAKILASGKVKVIASQFANTNVEAPSVPGEVSTVFDRENVRSVLDIGGEDMGARIVSVLKERIMETSYELLMVVNVNRPFTGTSELIVKMMHELEEASGLKITGIVNNTNLLEMTEPSELVESGSLLEEVTRLTGVPVVFASGADDRYPEQWGNRMPDGLPFLRLVRTIRYIV
ncbi:MAG: hypothetical protein ACYC5K_06530 [Saccharofermentanales bacterium]